MQKGNLTKESNPSLKKPRKMALGRGLDALFPDIETIENQPSEYFYCDIEQIYPNRYQPRLKFCENELEELCSSIKEQGIIQPLLVRKDENGYELIAGERRLRAAKMAGFTQVPVVLKKIADVDLLEISIIENIQREDLNPMEEAEAYHRLMTEFNLTQEQAAERVGKSRSAVANFLRLRRLPEPIKADIVDGKMSMGHARALLGADTSAQQIAVWRMILAKDLSVREVEKLIKGLKSEEKKDEKLPPSSEDIYLLSLAEDLSRNFGTRVRIKRRGKKGKVEIEFFSNDDLDRLISLLKKI
ncbi:MAG: ParB/RepB/Spo0J family partition protein [Desulfobacterales bacterium]|nr:ParB/RepB/Spo0J family partition protein [Desulfobacterales bacterium]